MSIPYYVDDNVTLYLDDCRLTEDWLASDVLVTDPPYGRGWKQGNSQGSRVASDAHAGIAGDETTEVRDAALAAWGSRPAILFGDLMLAPPQGTKQVLVYRKPPNAGTRGCIAGYRRDLEALYLVGRWPSGLNARATSLISTAERSQGNPHSPQGRFQHPHAKPIDVMCELLRHTTGTIADPFAGSGSTLVAAKLLGRRAIGVEIDEAHCEMTARRLQQEVFDFGDWEGVA